MKLATAGLICSLAAYGQFPRPNAIKEGCPASGTQAPRENTPADYVASGHTICFGSCPQYDVHVFRDGKVTWNGEAGVERQGHAEIRIDAAKANELIERFRTVEFWSLCDKYSVGVTDLPTDWVEVQLGGKVKKVSDYGATAPELVRTLLAAVEQAADSHQWVHSDPKTEPLVNIRHEVNGKLGLTPLMRAILRYDLDGTNALLAAGANVDDTDASGWTALMYAAPIPGSQIVPRLIAKGADVNHRSPSGDTPLMASALNGVLSPDLIAARARINEQNAGGVSALMILVSNIYSTGLTAALEAGADVRLKDAKGLTALDYLERAHCRHPLIAGFVASVVVYSAECVTPATDDHFAEKKGQFEAALRIGPR